MAYDLTDKPTQQLLAFIRRAETGRDDRPSYDTMFGFRPISPPLTTMTIDQAIAAGPEWTRRHGSSAAGAYQFMNATLRDLKAGIGLYGNARMTPHTQDMMAFTLLSRRGYQEFMRGDLPPADFAKRLAMEWASFPVLEETQGRHRMLRRGESYYAGDALNKARVQPEAVEKLLLDLRNPPLRDLEREDARVILGVSAAVAAAIGAVWAWVAGLPCNLFGVFCG